MVSKKAKKSQEHNEQDDFELIEDDASVDIDNNTPPEPDAEKVSEV